MKKNKKKEGSILDNQEKIKTLDSESQFKMVSDWPTLIPAAIERAEQLSLPKKVDFGSHTLNYCQEFSNILICGMGGSAIGGTYAEAYLRDILEIPIFISRKHKPPRFASPSSLVIICSYSGNTEETIHSFLACLERKAPIIAITSGGMLAGFCQRLGIPILTIEAGYRPRAALPLLFSPIPVVISRVLKSFDYRADFDESLEVVKNMQNQIGLSSKWSDNPAKKMAASIAGTIPMVSSSVGCLAYRLRCQLNENAKLPAFDLEFPELGHNHIMAFESHPRNLSLLSLIHLALNSESNAIRVRTDYLKALASKLSIPIYQYEAQGHSLLAQMFSLTYFGDYVSLYASVLRGIDPSPTTTIDNMKEKIEQENPWKADLDAQFHSLIL